MLNKFDIVKMRLVNLYWPVAQIVERLTVNQMVTGSSPVGSAILVSQRTVPQ